MLEIVITSSLLILIVVILRFALRSWLSPTVIYALWAVVALRLLVPFSIADTHLSVMNLFRSSEPAQTIVTAPQPEEPHTGTNPPSADAVVPDFTPEMSAPPNGADTVQAAPAKVPAGAFLKIIWLCGTAAIFVFSAVSNLQLFSKLKASRKALEGIQAPLPVYTAEDIGSPFLFGLLRPAIYMNDFAAEDKVRAGYVITHELTHYRHLDHIWAVVRVVCLAVHWFNPLVWLAAYFSHQDSELACDSTVIRAVGEEYSIDYGRTLVDMISTGFRLSDTILTSTTMTSGAKSVKERISMIKKIPQNVLWAVITAVLVLAVAVGCTFTGGTPSEGDPPSSSDAAQTEDAFPDLLSEYYTQYDSWNLERAMNIELAASLLDETVVQPGESFSFNRTVGERSEERGFVKAKSHSSEIDAEECGVGVPQVASTLYNAAIMADLQIVEHHNHPFVVSYCLEPHSDQQSFGNDAFVVYGGEDLTFTNNSGYPIMIDAEWGECMLTVRILGTCTTPGKVVSLEFSELETEDSNVIFYPPEEDAHDISGQLGRTIAVHRVVTVDGEEIRREEEEFVTYDPFSWIIYTSYLPEGYEYYTEYPNSAAELLIAGNMEPPVFEPDPNSVNPYDGMTVSELWSRPELEYLLGDVPVYDTARLTYALHAVEGEYVTEEGRYNICGYLAQRNMLVLMFETTHSERVDYINTLKASGFTNFFSNDPEDPGKACVLYNAGQYGIGIQMDGSRSREEDELFEFVMIIFEQSDGCYGFGEPIPKG